MSRKKFLLAAALIVPCTLIALLVHGQTSSDPSVYANDPAAMLAGYRHVEVSSVSDAIEQLTGQRMYMTHHMQPIFTTKFAGYAVTVKMVKEENHDPNALSGMLQAIDQGSKDSVYVMTIPDGVDIAGMGGLMGTAMSAREFSGAVIDGAVRDVAYLRKIAASLLLLRPATIVWQARACRWFVTGLPSVQAISSRRIATGLWLCPE